MITNIDKLMEAGCSPDKKDRVCRSRGGESCAFDGAMIVLQPIADTAHIVHGPIACCGNSWEGRGTLSSRGDLHRMGFTTDMNELDIVYGSGQKLYDAICRVHELVNPRAVFVYATCVSGLIGEDIEAVCRNSGKKLGIPVIPVNAPGFVGPKNLGNRIAGEILLDHVIGTGEPTPPFFSPLDEGGMRGVINLIGEYNIAGDLWLVEPLLRETGIRVLSRITGDASFEEITYAHRAKLNVVVCSRALINVAKEMEKKYGIPYVEVSFFGKTEMSKALRSIGSKFEAQGSKSYIKEKTEAVIEREEKRLEEKLKVYEHLKGKKAVLYTGGVKSWALISALLDLGIEVVAVGTRKSTFHDEEKMKELLGEDAPLVEDVSPANLLKLLKERNADILIAGGRNQYLAIKEGYPFVDVNQERHTAYAGYRGLLNFAVQINNGMKFYEGIGGSGSGIGKGTTNAKPLTPKALVINPLKHSQSIGAAIAFQGIDNALPIIHGAQGCTFLGKVLLTKHFREPIALAGTKIFAEDVIMGSEEGLSKAVEGFLQKNSPDVIGVLTSGLTEAKGDDVMAVTKSFNAQGSKTKVLHISTPDYEGGLETGYSKAVDALVGLAAPRARFHAPCVKGQVNVLAGSHLTPADFTELREIIESFGLRPIILPDLSALDGSRQGISPLSAGGTTVSEINCMGSSEFTIAIGMSMEGSAALLKERCKIDYTTLKGLSGLTDTDLFMELLSCLSGRQMPEKYKRQRRILIDGMRDAHFFYGGKRVCIALDPDLALQTSRWVDEMGAVVGTAVIPHQSQTAERVCAQAVVVGDLSSIEGEFDIVISNSHAEETANRLGIPLYQMGFPVYKILGGNSRIAVGYRGSLTVMNDVANLLMKSKEGMYVKEEVCV